MTSEDDVYTTNEDMGFMTTQDVYIALLGQGFHAQWEPGIHVKWEEVFQAQLGEGIPHDQKRQLAQLSENMVSLINEEKIIMIPSVYSCLVRQKY